MKFALFYQSVISDWNHGNAHFLRGLMRALQARGHQTICYEQVDNWSLTNLLAEHPDAIERFVARFPDLAFVRYALDDGLDVRLRAWVTGADVVIVHEWNEPCVISRIAEICRRQRIPCYFHDTHYRVVLDAGYRGKLGLEQFDGILAFSPSVAAHYERLGFRNVHVVHEAADVTVFKPLPAPKTTDVVYVGNFGDGDRTGELNDFLFQPRKQLADLTYAIYGVRYPDDIVNGNHGGPAIDFRGWVPNAEVPCVYSSAKVALHIPRRQYVELLPGTPTIRVFEALASGVCLVSLPWPDPDSLFCANRDFAIARTPDEMRDVLDWLAHDDCARDQFGCHGRQAVLARHTCDHRANQLLEILS